MPNDPYLSLLRAIPAGWRIRIAFDVDIHSCRLFPDRHAYTHCVFSLYNAEQDLMTEFVRPVIHPHLSTPTTPQLVGVAALLTSQVVAERGEQLSLFRDASTADATTERERQVAVDAHQLQIDELIARAAQEGTPVHSSASRVGSNSSATKEN